MPSSQTILSARKGHVTDGNGEEDQEKDWFYLTTGKCKYSSSEEKGELGQAIRLQLDRLYADHSLPNHECFFGDRKKRGKADVVKKVVIGENEKNPHKEKIRNIPTCTLCSGRTYSFGGHQESLPAAPNWKGRSSKPGNPTFLSMR